MNGKPESPERSAAAPTSPDVDPQWERAHQAWHLVISTPADELTSAQRRALFQIIRTKRFERETVLRSLPGAVRKGAKVDLAHLECGLKQVGITCSLKYFGESLGEQT